MGCDCCDYVYARWRCRLCQGCFCELCCNRASLSDPLKTLCTLCATQKRSSPPRRRCCAKEWEIERAKQHNAELQSMHERLVEVAPDAYRVEQLGGMEKLEQDVDRLQAYRELGSVEEIERKLDALSQYEGLGSRREIDRKLFELAEWRQLGSLSTVAVEYEQMKAEPAMCPNCGYQAAVQSERIPRKKQLKKTQTLPRIPKHKGSVF